MDPIDLSLVLSDGEEAGPNIISSRVQRLSLAESDRMLTFPLSTRKRKRQESIRSSILSSREDSEFDAVILPSIENDSNTSSRDAICISDEETPSASLSNAYYVSSEEEGEESSDDVQIIGITRKSDYQATKSRKYPNPLPSIKRNQVNYKNAIYTKGDDVEFADNSFMRVVRIEQDISGKIFLVGKLLNHAMSMPETAPMKLSRENRDLLDLHGQPTHNLKWPSFSENNATIELVWMVEEGSGQYESSNGLQRRPLIDVLGKEDIVFTNVPWAPQGHSDHVINNDFGQQQLVCRWKYTEVFKAGNRNPFEWSIQCLRTDECDKTYVTPPSKLRRNWRGKTNLGGSGSKFTSSINVNTGIEQFKENQVYTMGDSFCGAGGMSCGARDAGLELKWAFDTCEDVIKTHAMNFAKDGTKSLHCDVTDFITRIVNEGYIVDILHLSPPCQPFSPANTTGDEERNWENKAVLFAVQDLIERTRPRVITVEETEGLQNRHGLFFNQLISVFIAKNYSVRWTVLKCNEFGVPQARRRLVIFAAG